LEQPGESLSAAGVRVGLRPGEDEQPEFSQSLAGGKKGILIFIVVIIWRSSFNSWPWLADACLSLRGQSLGAAADGLLVGRI